MVNNCQIAIAFHRLGNQHRDYIRLPQDEQGILEFSDWEIKHGRSNNGRPTVVNEYQGNLDDGRDFPSPLPVRFLQSFKLALVLFGVYGAGGHNCRIFPVVGVIAFPDSHRFKSVFFI